MLSCASALDPRNRVQPNFIVVFTDDLGYGDLGVYGATGFSTPRLDQMAEQGIRFTDFYVPSSLCTQSRFALMTGRYSIRAGLDHVLFPSETIGIPEWEVSIAQALKPLGYQSACIGKWHLGSRPQYLPPNHGFDYFYGLPHSNDMSPLPLYRNSTVIEMQPDQDSLTARYTQEATDFIKRRAGQPFFLYLAHSMPHVPLHASARFRGRSALGLYGDVIEEIDWSVGEVLDTLDTLGLSGDTLVLFTSDNGPWQLQGANGGSAGPLRAGKGTAYEGGVRLPLVARWPTYIPPHVVSREVASTLDFLPTLVTLAGGTPPADRAVDGVAMWPVLSGAGRSPHDVLFFYVGGQSPLALRAGRWKLHLPTADRPAELYDLRGDIGEQRDLAADQPDVLGNLLETAAAWGQRVHAERVREHDL